MYEEEGSEGLFVGRYQGWFVGGGRISMLFFWRRPDLMGGLVWYVGEGRILRLLCRRRPHSGLVRGRRQETITRVGL